MSVLGQNVSDLNKSQQDGLTFLLQEDYRSSTVAYGVVKWLARPGPRFEGGEEACTKRFIENKGCKKMYCEGLK